MSRKEPTPRPVSIIKPKPPPTQKYALELHGLIKKLNTALESLTQGSTIRVYGIKVSEGAAKYRDSVALTQEQQELIREARKAYNSWKG